jgi:hypothetical protein
MGTYYSTEDVVGGFTHDRIDEWIPEGSRKDA